MCEKKGEKWGEILFVWGSKWWEKGTKRILLENDENFSSQFVNKFSFEKVKWCREWVDKALQNN